MYKFPFITTHRKEAYEVGAIVRWPWPAFPAETSSVIFKAA